MFNMQNNIKEKADRYLLLFGLGNDYTDSELNGAYRMLAKLNHPDLNKDVSSEIRMVIINEGYKFLQEYQKSQKIFEPVKKNEDIFYNHYKNAFQILKTAFDEYFGDCEDKSNTGNLPALKERLKRAKEGFSKIVSELPYSQWVDDSIDKINSINKWLDD